MSFIKLCFVITFTCYVTVYCDKTIHMDGEGSNDSGDKTPDGRIVGGKQAKLGQFPYQALLSMVEDDGSNANCGAALISDTYLLTAGHCSRFSTIKVSLGTINSVSLAGPKAVSLNVNSSHIYLHPNFDHWNLINDIAILELPTPVKLSEYIKPAALPKTADVSPDTFANRTSVISGWGLTETDTYALQEILRYAYANISEHLPCMQFYQLFDINDGTVCTQYHGTGTCNGDSGGPMVLFDNKTNSPTLIGITSFGTDNCTDNAPSVFTNVAYYLPWIHNITKIPIS